MSVPTLLLGVGLTAVSVFGVHWLEREVKTLQVEAVKMRGEIEQMRRANEELEFEWAFKTSPDTLRQEFQDRNLEMRALGYDYVAVGPERMTLLSDLPESSELLFGNELLLSSADDDWQLLWRRKPLAVRLSGWSGQ